MIFGTGVDIIEIARIKKSMDKYSGRFETRIFTQNEIDYCRSKADPAKHFAARFAVKEAVLKCLGTGMSNGIGWKDIEVENKVTGEPHIIFYGKGKEVFEQMNLKTVHISISHDKEYAIAHAIAEN